MCVPRMVFWDSMDCSWGAAIMNEAAGEDLRWFAQASLNSVGIPIAIWWWRRWRWAVDSNESIGEAVCAFNSVLSDSEHLDIYWQRPAISYTKNMKFYKWHLRKVPLIKNNIDMASSDPSTVHLWKLYSHTSLLNMATFDVFK